MRGVGNRISTFFARAVPAVIGKQPGLLVCSVIYVLFCRSQLDTFVMGNAVTITMLSIWTVAVYASTTLVLTAIIVDVIVLICALSLLIPIVNQLMAMRRCTPADCYTRYCNEAPSWARESLEGAYSYQIGLAATLGHYHRSWPDILTWNAGKQAKLADLIVRSRSSDQTWLKAWFDAHPKGRTRLVANLAWLLLNEPEARRECRKRIDAIIDKHGKKNN